MKAKIGFFLTALLWIAADQLSKRWIVSHLELYETIPVIQDFFHITYIQNAGASFGMLQNRTGIFILLTAAVLGALLWLLWREQPGLGTALVLGTVAGGAAGNLIDRLRWGKVIDFIDFRGIWSYIFNVADIGVVCGGALLVCSFFAAGAEKRSGTKAKGGRENDGGLQDKS